MRICLAAIVAFVWIAPAQGEVTLFAQYDWQDGAIDVSGSPIRHDGELEPGASVAGGKLVLDGDDGVEFGRMAELDGATEALFRFEDVTLTRSVELGHANYAVLAGDSNVWGVSINRWNYHGSVGTTLVFDILDQSNFPDSVRLDVDVSDQVVDHFDSIEYRFNGGAPLQQRFSIRWNDGAWITGGIGDEAIEAIPTAERVMIHNGGPSDWDPIYATLGTASFHSNQVPEPSTLVLAIVGLLCGVLAVWKRRR